MVRHSYPEFHIDSDEMSDSEISLEMRRYMAEGIDEVWYCDHGYYQGYDCDYCSIADLERARKRNV